MSADTVAKAARSRTGAVSTQAIYNVLSDLVSVGLVHRIQSSGSQLSTNSTRYPPSPHVPRVREGRRPRLRARHRTLPSCRRRSTVSQTSKRTSSSGDMSGMPNKTQQINQQMRGLLHGTDTVTEVVATGMPRIGVPHLTSPQSPPKVTSTFRGDYEGSWVILFSHRPTSRRCAPASS